MHPEPNTTTKRPFAAERPFPWRCRHCGRDEVVPAEGPYEANVQHDGRLHTFVVPRLVAPKCRACGERVFTEDVDRQVQHALRNHLRLLSPEEIRAGLDRLHVTQKEAAQRLGVAEATLSRWLCGVQVQSRSMDNLLRVFLAFPEVRAALCGALQSPDLGIVLSNTQPV